MEILYWPSGINGKIESGYEFGMIWIGYSDKSEKFYAIIVYLRLNSSLRRTERHTFARRGLFFHINNFSLYLPQFNLDLATSHFNCIPIVSAIFRDIYVMHSTLHKIRRDILFFVRGDVRVSLLYTYQPEQNGDANYAGSEIG